MEDGWRRYVAAHQNGDFIVRLPCGQPGKKNNSLSLFCVGGHCAVSSLLSTPMFRKGILSIWLVFVLATGLVTGLTASISTASAGVLSDEAAQWGSDAKTLATAPLSWEKPDWFWFETGIALTAASSLLDRRLYRQWNGASGAATFGNGWALAAPAGAVLFYGMQGWLGDDNRALRTAGMFAEAATFSVLAAGVLKVATGRERPVAPGTNNGQFHPGNIGDARTSFPSGHVALAFSVVGVLSAHRDMPWWSAPAAAVAGAVTMFARIRDKRHWASDTVAAALIGFGIGNFVASQRDSSGFRPMMVSDATGIEWRMTF